MSHTKNRPTIKSPHLLINFGSALHTNFLTPICASSERWLKPALWMKMWVKWVYVDLPRTTSLAPTEEGAPPPPLLLATKHDANPEHGSFLYQHKKRKKNGTNGKQMKHIQYKSSRRYKASPGEGVVKSWGSTSAGHKQAGPRGSCAKTLRKPSAPSIECVKKHILFFNPSGDSNSLSLFGFRRIQSIRLSFGVNWDFNSNLIWFICGANVDFWLGSTFLI